MPSHLTRGVFRRLLSSKPLVFHRQINSASLPRPVIHHVRAVRQPGQRRPFMNWFQRKTERDVAEPLLDPGMAEMLRLDKKIHLVVRLQGSKVLAGAFNAFIKAKLDTRQPIEDFHAIRLLQTFETLEDDPYEKPKAEEGQGWHVSAKNLKRALFAISSNPEDKLEAVHNTLARKIYARIPKESYANENGVQSLRHMFQEFSGLLSVLCQTGETLEARAMLVEHLQQLRDAEDSEDQTNSAWTKILSGFIKEENEPELLSTLKTMEQRGVPTTLPVRTLMTTYYARNNRVAETKEWFSPNMMHQYRMKNKAAPAMVESYQALMEFCLRNQQMEWAADIFKDADRTWQQKAMVLAAASTGKSVQDVDRMLSVMARRNATQDEQSGLDISVFNSLIAWSAGRGDLHTAERWFALAQKWKVEPDAQTYIQQVSYRLDAGDYGGAQDAYQSLRDQPILANEDWDVMNKLVRVLVTDANTSRDVIMGLVADLSQRQKLFPAATVSALVGFHLERDEYFELVDLLHTYAHQYSVRERQAMLAQLAAAALAPEQDTARTWDTYMVFHQVFDVETTRALRQAVMARMFARARPDLGTHVFTRMLRHQRADTRPDAGTYVAALAGLARAPDADALAAVHNALKLDTDVEPGTRLRTALMLAYGACGAPFRALELWAEVAASAEGPSRASLHAALRAAERVPFGDRVADGIWARLRAGDVAVDAALFASYVGALAGNRRGDDAVALLGRMQEITGEAPGFFVMATLFNASRGVSAQAAVQEWMAGAHPALWAALEARGFTEDVFGIRAVRDVDRSVDP